MRTALLMGGGLESSLLYRHLERQGIDFTPVFFRYGQVAEREEIQAIAKFVWPKIVEVYSAKFIKSFNNHNGCLLFGSGSHPEVLGRNLYFCLETLKHFDTVYIGAFDKNDWLPDASEDYFAMLNGILAMSFKGRKAILTPLFDMDIKAMVKDELARDPKFLDKVFSCWTPKNGNPCGECKHCKKIESLR